LLSNFREACQSIWKKQIAALSIQWNDLGRGGEDDEDDSDDNFDDEFSDLEEDVAPSGSNAPGIVNHPAGNGRGKKKEEEDTKELKSLKTGEFFDSLTIAPPSSNSVTTTATTNAQQLQPSEFLVSNKGTQWEPPKQVVKRITRKIKPDGSETIEVRFIVSDVEVNRVQALTNENQTASTIRRKNPLQALPSQEAEDLFEDEKSEAQALKLNIGKMKHKVTPLCLSVCL
jgi:hypothetical protein